MNGASHIRRQVADIFDGVFSSGRRGGWTVMKAAEGAKAEGARGLEPTGFVGSCGFESREAWKRVDTSRLLAKKRRHRLNDADACSRELVVVPTQAVGVGFEPTVRLGRTPVFKTGSLNHSDTPPGERCIVAHAADCGAMSGRRLRRAPSRAAWAGLSIRSCISHGSAARSKSCSRRRPSTRYSISL